MGTPQGRQELEGKVQEEHAGYTEERTVSATLSLTGPAFAFISVALLPMNPAL